MRIRTIFFIVAILLLSAFVALTVDEFTRASVLSLGFTTVQASLGLIMLLLLVLATAVFLAGTLYMQSTNLLEARKHTRELNAQRELADKAEASRFTDLRTHLDTQLRELRERDAIAVTELQKAVVNSQRELRTQLEQMNHTLAARLSDMDARLGHSPVAATARAELLREEQARAQLRDAQELEQRAAVREETAEERAAAAAAAGRPPEAGWRKWF